MKGLSNSKLLEKSKFKGSYTSIPKFSMVDLGSFPGLLPKKQEGLETQVKGEVYEVDSISFKNLDRLEGNPNFYKRQLINVAKVTDGKIMGNTKLQCWAYIFVAAGNHPSNFTFINSGDYRKYLNNKINKQKKKVTL